MKIQVGARTIMGNGGESARRFLRKVADEEGTISVLTIGLFSICVALLILITDVASISVSRQSLVHVTEAAAIRASHRLDLGSYYRGTAGVAVPIDCQAAYQDVIDELNLWLHSDGEIRRQEVQQIRLMDFVCSDNRVQLSMSGRALLPFRLPQGDGFFEIHATVEAQSDRAR